MTITKAVLAITLLSVAACARTEQLACGPALPPIATTAQAVPPGFSPPAETAPPAATPVAAAAPAAPAAPAALTPAQRRALNPLENRAAVAGR